MNSFLRAHSEVPRFRSASRESRSERRAGIYFPRRMPGSGTQNSKLPPRFRYTATHDVSQFQRHGLGMRSRRRTYCVTEGREHGKPGTSNHRHRQLPAGEAADPADLRRRARPHRRSVGVQHRLYHPARGGRDRPALRRVHPHRRSGAQLQAAGAHRTGHQGAGAAPAQTGVRLPNRRSRGPHPLLRPRLRGRVADAHG